MYYFGMLSLLTFVICVVVGALVFLRAPKETTNRVFAVLSAMLALQALIEFGYRFSTNLEQATLWWQLDFLWPFTPALALHLVASATYEKKLSNRKLWFSVFYLPAVFFSIADATIHCVTGPPMEQYWGWSYSAPLTNPIYIFAHIWINGSFAIAFFLAWKKRHRTEDQKKKKQLSTMIFALLLGASGSLIEMLLRSFSINIPPVIVTTFIFADVFFGIAIWKYEMFALTPGSAAENLIATMTDALLLVDPRSKIITVNNAAKEMLGWTEQEFVEKDIKDIFADLQTIPGWLKDSYDENRHTLDRVQDFETSFVCKNGRTIPISLSGAVHRSDKGKVIGFLLIGRDIESRKRTQEQLERYGEHLEELVAQRTEALISLNKSLQKEIDERQIAEKERESLQSQLVQSQKLEAVGRLAGGVAHDFNNMLTVIVSYSDMLLTDLMPDDPTREIVDEIFNASQKAAGLTKQLLAFSRTQVIEPKLVELNEVVRDTQKMLGRVIGEDVELSFVQSPNPEYLIIDPVQLEQVLVNLLVNARDAMPLGGTIEVKTSRCLPGHEPLAMKLASEQIVHLSVRDNGTGMEEQTVQRIFEPFFTTKAIGKGTGLGLSTVYGIVKQNGGHIEVNSKKGVGTTFHIYLPLADPSIDVIDAPGEALAPVGDETILLVEDEQGVRRVVLEILTRQGYDVIETGDAKRALEILRDERGQIDLLLTDVVMPGMNGRELADIVRKEHPGVRLLFMSGYNDEIIDQHGLLQQGVQLIQKPFDTLGLSHKIREVLDVSDVIGIRRYSSSFPEPYEEENRNDFVK